MFQKFICTTFCALAMVAANSDIPSAMAESPQMKTMNIKANWHFRGHGARSDAEKRQLGQEALERKAAARIKAYNSLNMGAQFELVSVQFNKNENGGSKTTGARLGRGRKHECWATAVGTMIFRTK